MNSPNTHTFRSLATDDFGRDAIDRRLDDEAAADPILDHIPQAAPKHKIRGVLGVLDQLDKENSNRRFNA